MIERLREFFLFFLRVVFCICSLVGLGLGLGMYIPKLVGLTYLALLWPVYHTECPGNKYNSNCYAAVVVGGITQYRDPSVRLSVPA